MSVDPDDVFLGDHGGAAYVFDGQMILALGSSPDLFASLSSELDKVVVVCGYETVSGSYTFLAAERGKLIRYLSTSTSYRQPLTMGAPLPSEARVPLGSVAGIHAALAGLGFDVEGWHASGSKVAIDYPENVDAWSAIDGPLGLREVEAAHRAAHEIPFEQWSRELSPQVVLTHGDDPAAGLVTKDGAVGFKIEMRAAAPEAPPPRSWLDRLRGWFGG